MSRYTIQNELKGIGVTGSTVRVETPLMPQNRLVCLQRVTVANLTSAGDKAKIGVKIGSNILWLETITMTNAGDYYALVDPVYINTCRNIVTDFTGTTNGDNLEVYVYGYYLD